MTSEAAPESLRTDLGTVEARVRAINELDLPMAAIERFLKARGFDVPSLGEHFEMNVAERLDPQDCEALIREFKYAGRRTTINYFVIRGINDLELDEIANSVDGRLPNQDEVEHVPGEPFLAATDVFVNRLYLAIGYKETAGSQDPETGRNQGVLISKRVVVVISEDTDLVEIRGSDEGMVEKVRDEVCSSIGKYQDSVKSRPPLGPKFQDKFNKKVERYYNLRVRVDEQENTTLDTIAFTSREDEDGQRRDARESERVERELSEEGSEITMGYVELDEGFKFNINREKSKLSFMKTEMEENLNQVTEIVDDVLREAGEYSQETFSGIEDVPE